MRRWIWALVIAAVISVVALGFLGGGRTAQAAGPSPGTGPWVDGTPYVESEAMPPCLDPSNYHPMWNLASEKGHCFKN